MSSRFVILHHTVHGGEHWDLMLEHGDVLLTWQLFSDPTASPVFPLRARRIRPQPDLDVLMRASRPGSPLRGFRFS